MTDSDPHWMSATELAAAIGDRTVSSTEALQHFVGRIEDLDQPINSVVQWDLERANQAARAADSAVVAGNTLGPLHGVPMTIKGAIPFAKTNLPLFAGDIQSFNDV